jgi:hypothetical protein
MKKLLYCLLFLIPCAVKAQDTVVQRIIYIGDAGEADKQQGGVLTHAQGKIIPGKTTVIYLGDNIYPTGMGLPGSKEEKETEGILQSQYQPMRSKGAPVYFIPGNHDWDRMGPQGLAKMKRQWEYISEQKDSLLKVVPENGCPGPFEIKISDNLVVIAFDSEWWVYIYSKENPDADCDCKTTDEVTARFREILNRNRDKVIMLADHHPFWSYGHHGGYYDIMDYFFPLTSVQRNLYVPLPGLGALYPLLRGTFSVTEDQGHPLYRNMIEKINGVFKDFPNVIHVSGHEHGLQFIKDHEQIQVVSGSGAKEAFVKKGKYALYAQTKPGFVTADLMADKSVKFTYYAGADTVFNEVFSYTKPYKPVAPPVLSNSKPITADSIIVKARPEYDQVSNLHRKLYGENYRKEWAAPVKLPVIKVSSFKGGLTPIQFGSVHQTKSLRLKDVNGKEWILSSIEKYPEILLPEARRETFAKSWVDDAMSGQHPYASLMVPVLADAVKVAHTKPIIGWVSPDKKLGFYEKDFAGTICLLEESDPGRKSDNTGLMMRKLNKDNANRVDTLEFYRARLLDWFIGDWDQQQDQWRWVDQQRGKNKYYSAEPRNREAAFFINEGVVHQLASAKWMSPYLRGYKAKKGNIDDFYYNGRELDARFLSGISYDIWMQTAKQFATAMTDSVLYRSLNQLPKAAYDLRHLELLKLMQRRRDNLVAAADQYYRFFNRIVDIKATDIDELFIIKDTTDNNVRVSVYKRLPDGGISYALFSKVFDHTITQELRIYASKGQDSVSIDDQSAKIKVRLIGGKGQKSYHIISANQHTKVYGKEANAVFSGPAANQVTKHFSNDSTTVGYVPVNLFNNTIPLVSTGYNPDDGFWVEGGVKFIRQGFRKAPGSTQQVTLMHGFGNEANRLRYTGEWFNAMGKADLELQARIYTPNVINYFGQGNNTSFNKTGDHQTYYRARFDLLGFDANARFHNVTGSENVRIGPTVQYYHYLGDDNVRLINDPSLIHNYDSETINKDKVYAGINATYIDDKRNKQILADWGLYLSLKLQGMAGLNSYSNSYVQITPELQLYKSVTTKSTFVISDKMGGGLTFGKTPFYQSLFLGGPDNMPGFRQYRFAGQQMFYNNLSARVKINNLSPYILPGQYGVTATYGLGRVWGNDQPSHIWHNSVAGGMYFAPADMMLLQLQTGYSKDGWYPYITLKLNI